MVIGLALTPGCRRPQSETLLTPAQALQAQRAAAAFLLREIQAWQRSVCIRVASVPGELDAGLVTHGLVDPPTDWIDALDTTNVRPYSKCSGEEKEGQAVTLALGWPARTQDGVEVPADRLCGWGCDRGFRVHVQVDAGAWRAHGARYSWVS
jgi:hypothetical protein